MSLGSYFKNLGESLFGQLSGAIETFLEKFVTEDLGQLAVQAVEYVETTLPGSPDAAKREAAKAQLIVLAKAAGKDLSTFGESLLNFIIEAAVQVVESKAAGIAAGVVASAAGV